MNINLTSKLIKRRLMVTTNFKVITKESTIKVSPLEGNLCSAPCIFQAKGIKKSFGGLRVLDDVDIDLHQGEVVLLRGENGSGKTTLLNILTGNIEPDAGVIRYMSDNTSRTYKFPRSLWKELNPFDHFTPEFVAREGIGRTWQDIRLFGALSLRDNIAVAVPNHSGENLLSALFSINRSARREVSIKAEAEAMLVNLGLKGREDSSADKISLGQTKRVAIARALAAGAKILFLDEPLAGLDSRGIEDILALLSSLVQEHKVTLVIIEHVFNQIHLRKLITTDWLLAEGKLSVSRTNQVNDNLLNTSTGKPAWFPYLVSKDAKIIDEPLSRGALLTRIRNVNNFQEPLKPALEINNLVVKRGPRTVIGLDNQGQSVGLNLTLYQGEIAILQAPNGWGKSTLFGAITGLIPIESGSISLNGHNINNLPIWERIKKGLSALPSERHSFTSLKTKEALKLAGKREAVEKLKSLAERACASLSGGQRQKLALASLPLESKSLTVLLDEPFSMLDSAAIIQEASKLRDLSGKAILILSPSNFSNEQQEEYFI